VGAIITIPTLITEGVTPTSIHTIEGITTNKAGVILEITMTHPLIREIVVTFSVHLPGDIIRMIRTNSLVVSTITTTAITTSTVAENRIVTDEKAMMVGMVLSTTQVIKTIVLTSERDRRADMTLDMMEEEEVHYYC
jgi:hypothetical protein